MKPLKIILYVNSFLPNVGGKEIVVHYLAREMKKAGHDVRIVGPSGWIRRRKYPSGYPVHRWPTLRGFFNDKVAYAQLRVDTALWDCDVLHAHTTYPNGYIAALLKKKRSLPLVITPHGHDIHMIPELGFGLRLDPLKRPKIDFALQKAQIVTAISNSVEASLIDAGCPRGKIRRISNGIDMDRFKGPHPLNVRQWLGLPEDAALILSVGNYHPRKGQTYLLRAMSRIAAQCPKARLVIVGGNQDQLAQQAKADGLENWVRLTGPIAFPLATIQTDLHHQPVDQLAALYCQSNVYVSAGINKESEGLSLALLDAMAAALPVVATRISGNADVVVDGKSGVLVTPGDLNELALAVVKALREKEKSCEMGREGKLLVAKYDWRQIASQYLEIYHEATGL